MMKTFINKLIYFSIIPVAIGFLCLIVYNIQINNLNINKSINILIIGDSHTQTGLDDRTIPNSINISQSSENYLYTYNVLKRIMNSNNNSHIKTIVLGVSFHSFSSYYDDYIQQDAQTKKMYPRYYTILDKESKKDIVKPDLSQIFEIYKKSINPIQLLSNSETFLNYPFIGSYYRSEKSNLTDSIINLAIRRHYYNNDETEQGLSLLQIKYFQKILDFCDEENLNLIIINTPLNYQYTQKIPSKFIDNYYSIIMNLKNIEILDYHSLHLPEDNFGDADHLNSKGANFFSSIIKEKIKY